MAKRSEILTAKFVEKVKDPRLYFDGDRLFLQVGPTGTKSWLFKYVHQGRSRNMGLGPFPLVSLKEAREKARKAKLLLLDGVDPLESRLATRDKERKDKSERITFKEAVRKFLNLHGDLWRSDKHRHNWERSLQEYAYPALGDRPVHAIDAAVLNEALADAWARVPSTAARVRERVQRVLRWVREGSPLPTAVVKRNAKNHPALDYRDLPAFMAEVRERQGNDARALEFLILTAARTGDVLGATWDEVNLTERVWTISAARMKAGVEHRVPLTDKVVALLKALPREDGNEHVFIGARSGGGLGHNALLGLTQTLRPGMTAHGFRASFKTWATETTNHPRGIVETALAHSFGGSKVERAYLRGDLFAKRARLMQDWATYCASKPATVLPMRKVKS